VAAGCGVSKELYETQLVRSQSLEARVADLEARLAAETEQRRSLEKALDERTGESVGRKEQLGKTQARVDDLDGRLAGCMEQREDLRADLDVCRRARNVAQADLERTQEELEAEKIARVEDTDRLSEVVAGLEARIAELLEEKEKEAREKREKLDEISRTYEGLLDGMKDEVAQGRVTISQLRGKLSVNVLDEILFDSGSAAIKPGGQQVLAHLGGVLAGITDKAVVIEGHTDIVPISGALAARFPTNWELSTARATSVVRYFQETAGIAPERLSAMGFGPYRPVATNETPEGRLRNRRIEIKLVPVEAPLFAPTGESAEEGAAEPEQETSQE
jgi:chemotaxis protein MotB